MDDDREFGTDESAEDVFVGGIGLLRDSGGGRTRYLARWDEPRRVFRLPMAQRLGEESLREVVEREIAWQFRLDRGRDFIVSSVPRLNFKAVLVDCDGQQKAYVVEFYVADLFGESGRAAIDGEQGNRWLHRGDLLGDAASDVPFDDEQRSLLRQADVLSPEDSDPA